MEKLLRRDSPEDGFTLVEILVVILIIGILASIAIPVFLNQRKTAADAAVHSDAKNAITAIQTMIADRKGETFDVTATNVKATMGGAGKAASAGTTIAISGNSNDWCVLTINSRANLNNWNNLKSFIYYNSKNGGWQDNSVWWNPTSCATSTGTSWTHIVG